MSPPAAPVDMRIRWHVEALRREGLALAAAAEQAGFDAAVPTCPGWVVRDLLHHLGGVHRWAASFVRDARQDPEDPPEGTFFTEPTDEDVLAWFRRGHADLVATLTAADPGVRCWSFLAAPSPLAFWARRQAHETTIHRVDAQSALAATGVARGDTVDPASAWSPGIDPVVADLAADGCAELLEDFLVRHRRKLSADRPIQILVAATDVDRRWTVRADAAGVRVSAEHQPGAGQAGVRPSGDGADAPGPALLTLRAPAADLYLLLWNRCGLDRVEASGDVDLWDRWRDRMRITWS